MKMGNFKPLTTVKPQKKKSSSRSPTTQINKKPDIVSKELLAEKIPKENFYMTQQNYFDAI